MRRAPLALLAATALAAAILAGCGSGDGDTAGATGSGTLIVLGASSLTEAVTKYGECFEGAKVKPSFAGSDELAAQIQQGAKADVFASADTDYPAELFSEGLVEKPRVFAANELVIAVPEGQRYHRASPTSPSPASSSSSATRASRSAPTPAPCSAVCRRPKARRSWPTSVSEETEVSSVVAKLEQGAADAGFVYVTDEKGAEGLKAAPIPPKLQPDVDYAAAVVKSSDDKAAAKEFVDGLIDGEGAGRPAPGGLPAARREAVAGSRRSLSLAAILDARLPARSRSSPSSPTSVPAGWSTRSARKARSEALLLSLKTTLIALAIVDRRRHARRLPAGRA